MWGLRAIPAYKLTKRDVSFFLSIMLPALVELVLSQVFAMVDTIMLGRLPDSAVILSAVGITSSPTHLIVGVVTAFCIGTTATVAIATGAGKTEDARCAARQSLLMLTVAGVVLSACCMVFAEPMMRFAGAKGEILAPAATYYRIIAAGFAIQSVTISITASFRGVGITKVPMLYNLASAGLNVFLNWLLIYGKWGLPAMGITGAALATTLSKLVAFAVALWMLFRGGLPISVRRGDSFRPDTRMMKRILKIGITSGMEQLILQSGAILSTKILAGVPTTDFAAFQVASSVDAMAWQPGGACCTAATTCMGQCIGEGRTDKAKAMIRMIYTTALCMCAVMIVLFLTCGRPIAYIYTPETDVAEAASVVIAWCALALPGVSTHQTIAGALRGAGDTRTPMLASLCSLWIFRVGLSWLLISVLGYGVIAMRICIACDQIVRAAINLGRYLRGNWAKAVQ